MFVCPTITNFWLTYLLNCFKIPSLRTFCLFYLKCKLLKCMKKQNTILWNWWKYWTILDYLSIIHNLFKEFWPVLGSARIQVPIIVYNIHPLFKLRLEITMERFLQKLHSFKIWTLILWISSWRKHFPCLKMRQIEFLVLSKRCV